MPAPLLLVGDIHLGRTPHRLAETGLDATELGPAAAWRRTVHAALEHDVQAVVLAGDVVDHDKDRFQAWSHLRDGVERLVKAGKRVIGVAGNHDYIALPRLASRISGFHLLGQGGVWSSVSLDGVDLLGWSFTSAHHRGNPLFEPGLEQARAALRDGVPAIGVLHCDLDGGQSAYAPVPDQDLRRLGLAGWFLGHIHQPGDLRASPPVGYLGSLVGLDRSETGPRGPWLVQPQPPGAVQARQLPLGPVHWLDLTLDLTDLQPGDDTQDRLHVALERRLAQVAANDTWLQDGAFEAVGCSITLTGRTAARPQVRRFIEQRKPDELVFPFEGVPFVVVRIHDETRPHRDLQALAGEHTPVGELAQLLLALDQGKAVPARVRTALQTFDTTPWTPAVREPPDPPDPVAITRRAALHLLDQLLDQRQAQEVG